MNQKELVVALFLGTLTYSQAIQLAAQVEMPGVRMISEVQDELAQTENLPFDPYANGYSDTWKYVSHPRYANSTAYINDTPTGYDTRRHVTRLSTA